MLLLRFQLGDEHYAIDAARVREVLPAVAIRPIAHAAAGVAGIADYRGTPLPVIDLTRVVLARAAAERLSTRLIVTDIGAGDRRTIALLAERVTDVMRCEADAFRSPGISSADAPYLGDVARVGGVLVQRVDVDRLLPEAVQRALFSDQAGRHGAC